MPLEQESNASEPRTYYLLVCNTCGSGDDALVMPFESERDRGGWAGEHSRGTGHFDWTVWEEQR